MRITIIFFCQNLQRLVDSLSQAKSAHELQDIGATLLQKVKTLKEDNKQNILEKLQHLMAERDAAFGKVCKLVAPLSQ